MRYFVCIMCFLIYSNLYAACRPISGNHVVMNVACGAASSSCDGVGTYNNKPAYGIPSGNSYCGGYGFMYCPVSDLHVCDNQDDLCDAKPELPQCESACAGDKSSCLAAGGSWSGSQMSTSNGKCCSSVCDLCNTTSQEKIANDKAAICCSRGMAPPDDAVQCKTPLQSGCGMTVSQISSNAYEYSCRDPNLSAEAMSGYLEKCYPKSSSSGSNSSSSGGGGSSSSGGGCGEECDWLRWILDTLTTQREIVGEIYSCLTNPLLCDFKGEDTVVVDVDSSMLNGVKTRQDSLLKLAIKIEDYIRSVDSIMKVPVDYDTIKYNDSSMKRTVTEGLGRIDTSVERVGDAIGGVKRSIDSLSMHIPDSILDSMLKYQKSIDSLIMHIPDSTLDSILKYQKLVNDTVLFGFTLVDTLIDSTVHYFQLMHQYDSIRFSLLSDSLGSINGSIEGLVGELSGGGMVASFDSAINVNGGGVDTSGVYLNIYGGELLADTIAHDVGYDKIDVARDTADLNAALSADFVETDSTLCVGSECITYDSESRIADSAQRYIAVQGDSLRASNAAFYKDSVDAMFQEVKDTLSKWNPFGMFDSTLMKTLGAKVPNSNTCPEHCSKYRVDIPFIFANLGIDLDWQLCASWAVLGGQNVMSFLRFIIRVIVAVTCIAMVMNAAANTKVK